MSESALQFPWRLQKPAPGKTLSLRPGIHWVRMPLPFALDHINLWMLEDGDATHEAGWAIVDAGVATPAVQEAWQQVWRTAASEAQASARLTRVIVTHMHPDHVGSAQWLIDTFSAPPSSARLWMSAGDHFAALLSCKETTGYGGQAATAFFRSHGLTDADSLRKIEQRSGYYASMVPQVPMPYRRLMHGMTVQTGQRHWRCITGYGHAPEHISLFDEADHTLISGDMILPKISTNVSVTSVEPEGDALGLYLDSIHALKDLPADTLVLPSHGLPFVGLHARIAQLEDHHRARLDNILQAMTKGPQTAASLLGVLFKRELDLHQTTFAMGESVAHLNHLWHRGEVIRHADDEGIWQFSLR